MQQAKLVILETQYLMVESEIDCVQYAIDKDGKGLYVISNNEVLSIHESNIERFASELLEVWKMYGKDVR